MSFVYLQLDTFKFVSWTEIVSVIETNSGERNANSLEVSKAVHCSTVYWLFRRARDVVFQIALLLFSNNEVS